MNCGGNQGYALCLSKKIASPFWERLFDFYSTAVEKMRAFRRQSSLILPLSSIRYCCHLRIAPVSALVARAAYLAK